MRRKNPSLILQEGGKGCFLHMVHPMYLRSSNFMSEFYAYTSVLGTELSDPEQLQNLVPPSDRDAASALIYVFEAFRHSCVTDAGILDGAKILRKFIQRTLSRKAEAGDDADDVQVRNLENNVLFVESLHKTSCADAERRRLVRTLQRMKEKGLYETSIPNMTVPILCLSEIKRLKLSKQACAVHNFVCGLLQCGARVGFEVQDLTDRDWMDAIEAAIIIHYPDELMDPDVKSYAIHITELIDEIRLFALLIHIAKEYTGVLVSNHQKDRKAAEFDDLKENYMCLQDRYQSLAQEYESFKAATRSNVELEATKAAAEKQHRADLKRIFALELEVERLTREKDHIAQLWTDEMAAIEAGRQAEAGEQEDESEEKLMAALTDEELFGSVELPEKNVLFLGGWPPLVQSVKKRHPDWLYINKNERGRASERIDTVFFFYEYISHKLVWRTYKQLRPDVKTIFVRQRNDALLDLEMKKGYAKLLNRGSEEPQNQSAVSGGVK